MLQLIREMLEVGRRLITSSCLRKPRLIRVLLEMTHSFVWVQKRHDLLFTLGYGHWCFSASLNCFWRKKVWTHCTHVSYYISMSKQSTLKIVHKCISDARHLCFNVYTRNPQMCVFRKKLPCSSPQKTRMLWYLYSSSWICIHEVTLQTPALDFTVEISRFSKQPRDVSAFPRATFRIEMNFKISNSVRYFFVGLACPHMIHFAAQHKPNSRSNQGAVSGRRGGSFRYWASEGFRKPLWHMGGGGPGVPLLLTKSADPLSAALSPPTCSTCRVNASCQTEAGQGRVVTALTTWNLCGASESTFVEPFKCMCGLFIRLYKRRNICASIQSLIG